MYIFSRVFTPFKFFFILIVTYNKEKINRNKQKETANATFGHSLKGVVFVKKKQKPEGIKPYDHLDDIETNACSATECTGLMMQPPESTEEWEAYMEVYDFGPPLSDPCRKHPDAIDK